MDDTGGPPYAAAAAGAAAAVSLDEMMQRCKCPVCLLHFRNTPSKRGEARSLSCSHLVCTGCLTNLIGQGAPGHCPVCRAAFNAASDPIPPVRELNFLADGVGRLQAAFAQQEEDLRVALERLRTAEEEQRENHRLMRRATDVMQKLHAEKVARAAADAAAADEILQTARAMSPPPEDMTVTVHILSASASEEDAQTARATTPPRVAFAPGVFNDGAPGSAQQVASALAAAPDDVEFDVETAQSPRSSSSSSSSASLHTARRCYSQSHNATSPVGAWAVAARDPSSNSSSSSSSSSGRSQHHSAGVMTRSTPPNSRGRSSSGSTRTARSASGSRGCQTPHRAFTPASRSLRNPSQVSFPNAGPNAPVLIARSRSGSIFSPTPSTSRVASPAARSSNSVSSRRRSSAQPRGRAVTPAPGARKGRNAGSGSRHASPAAAVKRAVSSARSSKVSSVRSESSSSKSRGRATAVKAKRQSKASVSRGRNSKSSRGRSAKKAPMRRSKRSASAEATRRIHAIYNPRKSV